MARKKWLVTVCTIFCCTIIFSQNVGIGTISPVDKLTVQTTGSNYGITHTDGVVRLSTYIGASGAGWLGTATNHPLHFFIGGGSPIFTLATSGNVGIGVLSPAYKLEVSNRIRIRSQGTNGVTAGIWFNNYNNTAEEGFIGEVGPGAPNHIGMYGAVSGWQLVMNTLTGNVGINTFATGSGNGKLNIASPGNAIKLHGGGQYISFYDAGNNYKGYLWNPGNNIEIGTETNNTLGEVNLKVKGIHGVTVQSDGRVRIGDIGCTTPVYTQGNTNILPRFSSLGQIGIKKDFGDRLGEWTMSYSGPFSGDGLAFHFNGGLKTWLNEFDGGWDTPSDIRLKDDFEAYKSVLDGIRKINVLTYHYKAATPGVRSFGLIAQNVHQYFPEIVSTGGHDGLMGIDYAKTGVIAIKAIQEQQEIIESQQRKIDELERRLERLEKDK